MVDRNKLEAILADPDFMALPDNEQESFLQEMEQPKGPSFEDVARTAVGPIYRPAKAMAQGYGAVKEAVTEPISHALPEGGVQFQISAPNPMFPASQIPLGKYTGRQALKELAGLGFDQAATFGLAKTPKLLGRLGRTADNVATSVLRRIGGISSGDIKATRELSREFGPEFVFSKTKAKPEYIGREIRPKAESLIKKNVRTMQPDTLRAVGVPEESVKFSQKVKGMTGIKELPTEGEADKFFQKTIESLPDDINIEPTNFRKAAERAIAEIEPGLGKEHSLVKSIRTMINGLDSQVTDINTLQRSGKPLTKEAFVATRRDINRLFGGNQEFNRFVQPLKEALDKDASLSAIERGVSAPIGRARTMYRLPRELKKAEAYVNKPNFSEAIESDIKTAARPENVGARESLQKVLGPEADPMMKDIQAQRIAKEFYASGGNGPGVSGRPILDIIKGLLRPLPREYEKGRATLSQALRKLNP